MPMLMPMDAPGTSDQGYGGQMRVPWSVCLFSEEEGISAGVSALADADSMRWGYRLLDALQESIRSSAGASSTLVGGSK